MRGNTGKSRYVGFQTRDMCFSIQCCSSMQEKRDLGQRVESYSQLIFLMRVSFPTADLLRTTDGTVPFHVSKQERYVPIGAVSTKKDWVYIQMKEHNSTSLNLTLLPHTHILSSLYYSSLPLHTLN